MEEYDIVLTDAAPEAEHIWHLEIPILITNTVVSTVLESIHPYMVIHLIAYMVKQKWCLSDISHSAPFCQIDIFGILSQVEIRLQKYACQIENEIVNFGTQLLQTM